MEKIKYSIIGCGVVGLAVAAELSQNGDGDIAVFEKHESFGQETSSRNSEVIHAGLYYPPSSLKSRLCVSGNKMLYDYCIRNSVPFKNCGKLVVSTNEEEAKRVLSIYKNASDAGVPSIKLLSGDEAKKIEPGIFALNALYSATTGIIDTHSLMKGLFEDCEKNGAMFSFNSEINSIKKTGDGYILNYDKEEIMSEYVINSAGLSSDKVAMLAGFDIDALNYRLHLCKGDYFKVSGPAYQVKHLVYPPPHEKGYGLGIHATLDLTGHIRLGPDATYVNSINYDVSPAKRKEFFESANKYLPWLKEESLSPDTAGIRPKLQGENDSFRDFVIKEGSENESRKFINLIGIESPGFTSCLAIAGYVKELINHNH